MDGTRGETCERFRRLSIVGVFLCVAVLAVAVAFGKGAVGPDAEAYADMQSDGVPAASRQADSGEDPAADPASDAAGAVPYDRDAAVDYAERYARPMAGWPSWTELFLGRVFGAGRNPDYLSYGSNCANFASQVLVAGGLEQSESWHAVKDANREDSDGDWSVSESWRLAKSQYEYFSDPGNGCISGKVVNVHGADSDGEEGMENIAVDDLAAQAADRGIRKGDLVFFYGEGGTPHHSAVVSCVCDAGVFFAANTTRRCDYPLGSGIVKDDATCGAYIVRMNDAVAAEGWDR